MISPSQRPLPENTQHSQDRDIHAPAGLEPAIPAGERPQNDALDRAAATGIDLHLVYYYLKFHISFSERDMDQTSNGVRQKRNQRRAEEGER